MLGLCDSLREIWWNIKSF